MSTSRKGWVEREDGKSECNDFSNLKTPASRASVLRIMRAFIILALRLSELHIRPHTSGGRSDISF